jgi:hypothetical protein
MARADIAATCAAAGSPGDNLFVVARDMWTAKDWTTPNPDQSRPGPVSGTIPWR